MKVDLGRRIKFFRKRAKMSQFDLETSIDGASGMISKIETSQGNPTKETILKIAEVLDLSSAEIDYLIGKPALPADAREIASAINEAAQELNKDERLNYLLDERWRFHVFSDTFKKFLYLSQKEVDYVIGKTTAQLIVRSDSPILERLDQDYYLELLRDYLAFYFATMSFMDDDDIYSTTVEDIMRNKVSREIWIKFNYENDRKYTPLEKRVIHFDLNGIKVPLYYSALPLPLNNRFLLVEYYTENKVQNLLQDLT